MYKKNGYMLYTLMVPGTWMMSFFYLILKFGGIVVMVSLISMVDFKWLMHYIVFICGLVMVYMIGVLMIAKHVKVAMKAKKYMFDGVSGVMVAFIYIYKGVKNF